MGEGGRAELGGEGIGAPLVPRSGWELYLKERLNLNFSILLQYWIHSLTLFGVGDFLVGMHKALLVPSDHLDGKNLGPE